MTFHFKAFESRFETGGDDETREPAAEDAGVAALAQLLGLQHGHHPGGATEPPRGLAGGLPFRLQAELLGRPQWHGELLGAGPAETRGGVALRLPSTGLLESHVSYISYILAYLSIY